jgi:long-chain fatty acid transport protein
MRRLAVACVVCWPALSWGGAFEIDVQSARATGLAGAQTAVADDAAAIFYNPAGMALQPGFNALLGGAVIYAATKADADGRTVRPWHAAVAPHLYVSQMLGKHLAVGIGSFAQFAEHFGYPSNWPGRFLGQFIDLTTATINPSLALRLPYLTIGGGVDIVPAQLDVYRAINFGGAEGSAHAGLTAIGVGGNAGILLELWPRRLRLGVSYRSRVDLDFEGHGAIYGPIELRALTGGLQRATTTLPLPHNLAAGLALTANHHLTLSADVRFTWWRDLKQITLTLTDPHAPAGTPPTEDSITLELRNSWSLLVGAESRVLHGHLTLRLGGGYESTPVPAATLGPLLPDSQRAVVSGGIGWHTHWADIDGGYLCAILVRRTSENPDLMATYGTIGNVFSLSVTIHIPELSRPIEHDEFGTAER